MCKISKERNGTNLNLFKINLNSIDKHKLAPIILKQFLNLFSDDPDVFYISGADTLPPPLEKEEEENLIEKLKAGEL